MRNATGRSCNLRLTALRAFLKFAGRRDVSALHVVEQAMAACVHLHGKGHKDRSVPLWKSTVQEIRAWPRINPRLHGKAALLPNRDGMAMTRCNVSQRLHLAVARAATRLPACPRSESPHTR